MTSDNKQHNAATRPSKFHDGFHLEVTAKEIRDNFNARLAHHRTALAKLDASPLLLVSKKGDIGKSDMIKLHKAQIRLIEFIVSHIPEQDTFALTMNEVNQLMLLNAVTDMGNGEEE